jgi:hypothetical protein
MMSNQMIESLLADAHVALTNAKTDTDLPAVLTPFGYDAERVDEGLVLLDAARTAYEAQKAEYADQYAATDALNAAAAAARAAYVRHVKLARVAFKTNSSASTKLNLRGDRQRTLDGWMAQARAFYNTLQAEAALQDVMARFNVDATAVTEAQAALDAVETARSQRQIEKGEAQEATERRDDAVAVLQGFMSDFYQIARIATEDRPQLLEKMGIVVPS